MTLEYLMAKSIHKNTLVIQNLTMSMGKMVKSKSKAEKQLFNLLQNGHIKILLIPESTGSLRWIAWQNFSPIFKK